MIDVIFFCSDFLDYLLSNLPSTGFTLDPRVPFGELNRKFFYGILIIKARVGMLANHLWLSVGQRIRFLKTLNEKGRNL